MSLPRTPEGAFRDINRRFFGGELPENVTFRWVADQSEGEFLDSRCEEAAIKQEEDGSFVMELNDSIKDLATTIYMVVGHECLHLKIGLEKKHNSKEWNREFRRLQGLGFFKRCF